MKIKVIIGSTREGRFGDKPAEWIFNILKQQEGIEAELLDLRDYPMPFFNEPISPMMVKGDYPNSEVNKWSAKIAEADGFIVVGPEYNHGYSAVLKNAFDSIYREWNNKPIGFVSYGSVGGAYSIAALHQVVIEMQMMPIKNSINIPMPWDLVEEDGSLKEGALEPFAGTAGGFIDQLLWWANILKKAREDK